jgi:hypothetical protein
VLLIHKLVNFLIAVANKVGSEVHLQMAGTATKVVKLPLKISEPTNEAWQNSKSLPKRELSCEFRFCASSSAN